MNFKEEVMTALQGGKNHRTLLDIARRYQAEGITDRDIYNLFEQIWLDFGYDDSDEESDRRNELEYTMERVWYYGVDAE